MDYGKFKFEYQKKQKNSKKTKRCDRERSSFESIDKGDLKLNFAMLEFPLKKE